MKEKQQLITRLSNVSDLYMPLIERQLEENKINFDEYSRDCVIHAISSINNMLNVSGIDWNDKSLDKSNVQEILMKVAQLQLNSSATPRECYFQVRNTPIKRRDENGKEVTIWKKFIEMGIEGNGNDALLARFGRDVKKVLPFWVVKEHDEFEYPYYKGIEMMPPVWKPKGSGKVTKVVYPVIDTNNIIHYYIGERDDVKKNLLAHINNNMMNETFDIAKDRYSATNEQKKQIDETKKALNLKLRDMTLEEILDSSEFGKWISPAWKEDFSREEMITRKIRNNIINKIPKDFKNPVIMEAYDEVTNDEYRKVIDVINEETASKEIELHGAHFESDTGEIIESGATGTVEENYSQNANLEPNIEDRKKPSFD